MSSKVTLITPIFNGEKFIEQYINTLSHQTYDNVELIIVDDGSTDETLSLLNEKKIILEEKGWAISILTQDNQGAASAVNNALKRVTGDYLMLFDVDDILMPENIKSKVLFLDANPNYGMVRNNGYMVDEGDIDNTSNLFVKSEEEKANKYIFDDLIWGRTNNWPGTFMIRFSFFLLHNPDLNIYTSQYGQNLQIMLPIAKLYKSGFIDKPLMKYIVYKRSHSHGGGLYKSLRLRLGYIENRIEITKMIPMSKLEMKKYISMLYKIFYVVKLRGEIELKVERYILLDTIKECFMHNCFPIRTILKAILYVIVKR